VALTPEERLAELGHELPAPNPAVANYVGAVTVGNIVFVSGHGPYKDGEFIYKGKLGREVDVATGQAAAALTIVNLLASLKAQIGELERVKRVVKLLVMVNSDPEFGEQPAVANGASDLLVAAFGLERGSHARSAVGMGALPMGISVEIEGIFEIG
jgi:enamine deaminase RidA (YjgF/YER057c/UK114 family)